MQRSPVLFRRKRRILRIRGLLLAVARGNCCSHASNRACSELRWCCFPIRLPKPHTGPHGGASLFFSPKRAYPSPKGGGAGYRFSWVCWVCSARSQTAHTAPTAPVWGCAGVVSPTRPPKPHTGAHRGEVGFTAFSWCASFAAVPPAAAPDGNSPPRGWARSCKAASRFSRFRPMSTR